MRLDVPKSGPASCPSVYSFVYGNVGVISLDANELSAEIRANTGYSRALNWPSWSQPSSNGAQIRRLPRRSISSSRSFHHCAYATGSTHGSDGGVRTALDKLFSTYQVDLAIQGHNHQYERTDPIRFGQSTVSAPDGSTISPATDGVSYLCVGSGGRAHGTFMAAPGSSAPAAAGASVTGPQALVEGQRYRGYKPAGGLNVKENNTNRIVNAFQVTAASGKVPEAIEWSQARYTGYAYVAFDVVPASLGGKTTLHRDTG